MEDGSLPNSHIKASSVADPSNGSSFSRLYSSSSWCSSTASPSKYLQVDLGHVKTVTGVATQGDPSSDKWVTRYDITYGYNGKIWIKGAANQQLTGNSDKNTVFVNWFSVPFAAHYVRIIPQAQHTSVCLRVDLYGCGHFQVPFLYVKDLSDVTLPTASSGGSVSLSCQAEFSQQRPATFTWSNSGKVLSTSTSSITVTYKGAVDTQSNYHCLRINPSSREVYCNTTYSVTASLPGMNVQETVQANVTAVLKVPDKPVVSMGIVAARSTTVTWNQPSLGSDEAVISSFKLEYSNNSFTSGPLVLSPGTTSKQLINLKPYTNYNVKVMATSAVGEGSWSASKTFRTSTAVPEVAPLVSNFTAITSQSIYVKWQKPDVEKINGPLKQYKIIYKETGASSASENIAAPTTSHTLRNLKKWTNYKVQVRVNNGDYDGPSSSEKNIRTMQDVPMAPQNLSAESPQKTSVILKWKKSTSSGVQTYLIRYHGKKNYYQSFNDTREIDTSGPVLSYKVQGLTPGTTYTFSVSTRTRCGIGPTSNEVIEETQVDIPRAPVVSEVKEHGTSNTSVFVIVKHVEEINGPISHYQFIVHHVKKWTDEIPDVYKNQLTDYEKSIKNKMSFYITAQINAFTVNPSRTFQIGDSYNYNGYENVPLASHQKYKIYFRAVTTVPKYLPGIESVVALITVMEAPQIIKELSPSNILVAQHQTAFLPCFANSSGSLKYDWLKDSSSGLIWGNVSLLWKDQNQFVQGSILQVSGKSEEALGEYTCSVTNEAGTTSHTVRLSRQSTICSGHSSEQTKSLSTVSLVVIICLSIALILLVVFNVYLWRIKRTRGAEEKYATTTVEKSERTELPAASDPGNESTSPIQRGNYMELLPRRTREGPHGTQLDSSRLRDDIPQSRTDHGDENSKTEAHVSYVNVNKGLEEQEIGESEIYEEIATA